MKIIVTENQLKYIAENLDSEARNITNLKAYEEKIQPLIDKLGDKLYGQENGLLTKFMKNKRG